jgi:hypothetical protein
MIYALVFLVDYKQGGVDNHTVKFTTFGLGVIDGTQVYQ